MEGKKYAFVAGIVVLASVLPAFGEIITVPSTSAAGVNSSPLIAGRPYIIESSGTWLRDPVNACDTEFYTHQTMQGWAEVYPWPTPSSDLLDLLIDNQTYDWLGTAGDPTDMNAVWAPHTFSPSHVYRLYYVGAGVPINLRISDDFYPGENSGSLTVKIPEPATLSLLVLGSLAIVRRRR